MHSADYAVAKCLSVCPSLPPSVTRRYCAETAKRIIRLFHHRVATSFYFFHTKRYGNETKGTPMEASNASGYEKITICDQYIYLVNDISYGHRYYGMRMGNRIQLSNGTIFNDLEQPMTQTSRSRHYVTLNISETVRNTDSYNENTNRLTHALLNDVISK